MTLFRQKEELYISTISTYNSRKDFQFNPSKNAISLILAFIGIAICMYPELSLAAPDSLEAMGKQVNTLAGGTIKKAVVTVGTVAGMAGGFFSGNIKLALAVLAVGIIMGVALVLNENGMALVSG